MPSFISPSQPKRPSIVVGCDLGKSQDPSALCAVERQLPTEREKRILYAVRGLRRWALGTPYTAIVDDVAKLMEMPQLQGMPLVIDATGVGRPVLDMFKVSRVRAHVHGVTITAGNKARWDRESGTWHVAKIILVQTSVAIFQQRRIKLPENAEAATLASELADYRYKITVSANETFAAREGRHDDLVLAASCALWWAEKFPMGNFDRETMILGKRAQQIPEMPGKALIKGWTGGQGGFIGE